VVGVTKRRASRAVTNTLRERAAPGERSKTEISSVLLSKPPFI